MATKHPTPELIRWVRSALAHLYDPAYLQNHPLVSALNLDSNSDRVTRAQSLRRQLLEWLEMLKPEGQERCCKGEAARAYAVLTYRYVDGLSMEEIAEKMALSRRHAYREHEKGIKAISSLVWDRIEEAGGRRQEAGGRRQEAGGRRQEARGRRQLPLAGDDEGRLRAAQMEVAHLKPTLQPESLSLQRMLEEISKLLASLSQQMGVRIGLVAPETWPPVVADRVTLRQTLMNLLSYALRIVRTDLFIKVSYAHDGLQITVHERAEADGSPAAEPPPLRTLPTPADEVSLAVAQALTEVQDGYLETGESGGWWWARIVLPISEQRTVLVVDDNADIIALFQRYLGGHAVRVLQATSGEQAMRLAAEFQPQAITLDVMMPNQDGWEVLQRLKSDPATRHIPVIICSVLKEPQLARAMGADDYITKPVNQVELLEVLLRWMRPIHPLA